MCSNINYKHAGINGVLLSLNSTIIAGISNIAGHGIGCLNAAGFGLIQGVVGTILAKCMDKKPTMHHHAIALTLGGVAAFSASHAAVAMGFVAAPITVPSAIVLTVVNLAFVIFKPHVTVYISNFTTTSKPEDLDDKKKRNIDNIMNKVNT